MKAWESKNAKNAAKAGGVSLMALSLAACGGSSTTTTTATDTTTTDTTTTTPVTGTAFTLTNTGTTTLDNVTGTTGADTFTAAGGRLNDGDAVSGLGGADVLSATIDASANAYISGVETINITALGSNAAMNGVRIEDATNINVSGGGLLTLTDAAGGIQYSVAGDGTSFTVTQAGTDSTADEVTVSLGDGDLGTITLGTAAGSGAVDFETVNVVVAGTGSATIDEASTANFAETGDSFVVTGSGDYQLNMEAVYLGAHATAASEADAVINATDHTGVLTVDLVLDTTKVNVSAKSWDGVDVIKFGMETATDAVSNVASGTTILIDGESHANDELTVSTDSTGSDDALTITLDEAVAGTNIDIAKLTVTGFENVTVNSAGTDSATATVKNVVDVIDTTTAASTLNLAGEKAITVGSAAKEFTTIAVTNTAGATVSVETGTAETSFTGGAGNDKVTFDTQADFTLNDTVVGGDGNDTLGFSAIIESAIASSAAAKISGFEVLEFSGANNLETSGTADVTLDLTAIAGLNSLSLQGATTLGNSGNNNLIVKADDGFTLRLGAALDGAGTDDFDVQITDALNGGTNNTVNLALDVEAAGGATAISGFQIDGVENLTIAVAGVFETSDVITIADIDGAQLQNIVITSAAGSNTDGTAKVAESLTFTALETSALSSIDASDYTGALTFKASGAINSFTGTGATVLGSSGANDIKGGSGSDSITGGKSGDTLTGEAGNDTIYGMGGTDGITGGAGNDVIYGGDGVDTITGGADVDQMYGGSGSDIFVFSAAGADTGITASTVDVIKDFDLTTAVGLGDEAIGDLIDISGATAAIGSTTSDANVTAVTKGVVQFADSTLTFDALAADALTAIGGVSGTDGTAVAFNYDGDGYVYILGSASDGTEKDLIKLEGIVISEFGLTATLDGTISGDQFFIA